MKRFLPTLCFLLSISTAALADTTPVYSFVAGKKYYIACEYATGYVALGSNHGSTYELYYVRDTEVADDGYWYVEADGSGYTIQHVATGQYLAWCNTKSSTCKYLTLVDDVDDNARWLFNSYSTNVTIQNVAQTSYYWNLRTSGTTNLMGCYTGVDGSNGYFNFYAAEDDDNDGGDDNDESGTTQDTWDSTKAYFLHNINGHGYVVYNPDLYDSAPVLAGCTVTSGSHAACNDAFLETLDESDPNAKWRVLPDGNGNYAFYNIGKEQYIYADASSFLTACTFSETPCYYSPTELSTAVYAFALVGSSPTTYLCSAPQQYTGSTITHWTQSSDEGCQFELIETTNETRYLVEYIELNHTTLAIGVGESATLTASVEPLYATNREVTWYSSDNAVATVTSDGQVVGIGVGTATITCSARDGSGIQATCQVTVTLASSALWSSSAIYAIHSINGFGYIVYNPDVIDTAPVVAGYTYSGRTPANTAYYNEMDETDVNNQWRIGVNSNGLYSFYNIGKDQYIALSNSSFVFSDTPTYFTAIERSEGVYVFSPESNNSTYLCMAPQQAAGRTIVTYGDVSDIGSQLEIVELQATTGITVRDIIVGSTAIKLPLSRTYTLPVSISPDDASNKKLSWTSSNTDVLTVSTAGLLTPVATGNATVTVAAMDASGITATCFVTVYNPEAEAVTTSADTLFISLANGKLFAYPEELIASREQSASGDITITTPDGQTQTYQSYEIVTVSHDVPTNLPTLVTYKFNNKYNDQLPADVIAEEEILESGDIGLPDTINLRVTSAIGKRLTASFNLSSDDATAYVDGIEQVSKQTRQRFDHDIVYTIAPRSYKVFSSLNEGADIIDISNIANPVVLVADENQDGYAWQPYGRKYTVHVDWATDSPTSDYNVPAVYITTENGASITSKTTYVNATISVDGAGVYPDFPETSVQIRIRGNTSASWNKKPYRLKFDTKQKLFNLKKGKSWALLSNHQADGSMITNTIAMKMADMVQSAGCNHMIPVELYLNGDYRGSYNFTEKVGFSNNSIDLLDETGAFMLELDTYYDETYKFLDSNYSLRVNIKEPDLVDVVDDTERTNQFQAIKNHFNTFTSVVAQGDDSYVPYVDVDALVRGMFVFDFTRNREIKHPKSFFLYNENALASDGLGGFTLNYESPYVIGPVWDFDWAYGYDGHGVYFTYEAEADLFNSDATFFNRLLRGSDEVKKAYYALWYDFMTGGGLDELLEYCDDFLAYVNPSFVHNATIWNGWGNNYAYYNTQAKAWLQKRANYIFNNLTAYDISEENAPNENGSGDANGDGVVTTADVVSIINYILGIVNDNFEIRKADVDANNIVTVRDVTLVIRKALEQATSYTRHLRLPAADAALRTATFIAPVGEQTTMPLTLYIEEGGYSALQFDVAVPEGMQLIDFLLPETLHGYSSTMARLDERHYRVSLYAAANNAMPLGTLAMQLVLIADDDIADDQRLVSITDAMLVDTDAEDNRLASISVRFHMPDETTAIARLTGGAFTPNATDAIYDLQGRRVFNPQHGGIYIVRGKKVVY